MIESHPTRRQKWSFWLLLSAYSTVFAEVVSGSDPFPFFHPWGILVVIPLYGLHTLVLVGLVCRHGQPRISTLFFSGALFGLYEAYITKILWSPTWDALFQVGGVAPLEIVVLVFWWHPFMAYILPLLVGEQLLTNSTGLRRAFPKGVRRFIESSRGGLFLAALAGLFTSLSSPNPLHTLASIFSAASILGALTWFWRRRGTHQSYGLQELLPNEREWRYMLAALIAVWYVGFGLVIRPEALPGLGPQAVIWSLYLSFGWMLRRSLRRSREDGVQNLPDRSSLLPRVKGLLAAYTLSALAFTVLPPDARNVVLLLAFLVGGGFGIFMLVRSLRETFSRRLTA